MQCEWDEAKNAANREKHGIAFDWIEWAEWGAAIAWPDRRKDYGETRIITYLPIEDRLHVAVYTMRGNVRRIISLRKANAKERDMYDQAQI